MRSRFKDTSEELRAATMRTWVAKQHINGADWSKRYPLIVEAAAI